MALKAPEHFVKFLNAAGIQYWDDRISTHFAGGRAPKIPAAANGAKLRARPAFASMATAG